MMMWFDAFILHNTFSIHSYYKMKISYLLIMILFHLNKDIFHNIIILHFYSSYHNDSKV